MASGSSGRAGSGPKGFDFSADDVLCSYDEFGNPDVSNGKLGDAVIGGGSGKDFRESRMGRSALVSLYNQQDESIYQDLISTVEKTMKKYADNLMRFLEGISARLSQLELYCYNLERSIGEMKSDLVRENSEADAKLRSLEKHLQEVHRSVQILRDKQELADAQKEIAKLQLKQKESSNVSNLEQKEEGVAASASDAKRHDSPPSLPNHQLALALTHQVSPPNSLPTRPIEQQPIPPSSKSLPQNVHVQPQQHPYYPQQPQLPSSTLQAQHNSQDQYLQADPKYQRPQLQVPQQAPQPPQTHVSLPQQVHPLPQYQQQWPQQFPQQAQLQPPSQQAPVSSQAPPSYPPYLPTQPRNPPSETYPGSMPMQVPSSTSMQVQSSMALQVPFSVVPQSGAMRPDPVGYGYGAANRPTGQQQPSQHNVQQQPQLQTLHNTYAAPRGDGAYPVSGPHATQAPQQGYMMYDGEGGRVSQPLPSHFQQGGYPPTHIPALPNPQPIRHPSPSQMMRSHQYGELIEKAASMGYPRDFVASVVHGMEETGQPIDVNSVLDRLNMHSSGGSQRPWSG